MLRAIVVLLAVVGVVAMHGLATDHDAAVASMGVGQNTSLSHDATRAGHVPVTADALAIASPVTAAAPADSAAAVVMRALRSGTAHSMHAAACCLAFLTGLLLLLGAGRRLARRRRAIQVPLLRHGVAWLATAVETLRPNLAELSVLRT